jgi:hypothetical protein
MANLGAQILAGSPKADYAFINPTHYIFLSKSDSPTWMLVDLKHYPRSTERLSQYDVDSSY